MALLPRRRSAQPDTTLTTAARHSIYKMMKVSAAAIAQANYGNVRGALLDWGRDLDRLEVAAA